MIIPMAAPRYGFPPNFFVALNPINTGKNANGALANMLIAVARPLNCGYRSMTDLPLNIAAVRILFTPINRPPATMAGMIGTKISLNNFTNL